MSGGSSELQASTSIVDHGTTRSGLRQLRRIWPADAPGAAVLVVHGLAEHSGRYEALGVRLSSAGLFTVAFDHRGFGASGGTRSYVSSFDDYVDDVEDQLFELRSLGVPIVLLGHSMGGLVALRYVLGDRPPPDAMVLSAPALGDPTPALVRRMAGPLSKVAPRLRVRSPSRSALLSRDPAVMEAFDTDPLVERSISARLGAEILRAMQAARDSVHRLDVPTLVVHGSEDRLVPTASSEVLETVPAAQRRVLPGLRHEPFNEPEGPEIVEDVIGWITDAVSP